MDWVCFFLISINVAYRKRSVFLALLYDTAHEFRGVSRQCLQKEQSFPSDPKKSQIGQDKSLPMAGVWKLMVFKVPSNPNP